ncbi:hypothetical protein CRUP_008762 [Coryphaenoides rupestris]|nr:hypothetical protein CRUP_008762 [Coryphaenoides rupestris]
MTSEPIPEGWDTQPVKQLVGMTLEKVVFNPDTTTFVLLCECTRSCTRLANATADRKDVVIARIDASANDINLSMYGSYPALRLFPAVYAEREDKDRKKYIEAMKAEEAKKGNESKDEL